MNSSPEKIRSLARRLDQAASYASIFGVLKGNSKSSLTEPFRKLAMLVHPDRITTLPAADRELAEATFRRLVAFSKDAESALAAGTYGNSFDVALPAFEIASRTGRYELEGKPLATGDFSTVYRGQCDAGLDVIVKIAATPEDNRWLEHEVRILQRFHGGRNSDKLERFIPAVLDTFLYTCDAKRYRCVVFERVPGLVSVAELIAAFPSGLDERDAVWVCRRILGQVCAAAMIGVVHGAMVPEHVLVGTDTHEPLHIGWAHAIDGGRLTQVADRWREDLPPEVVAGKSVDSRCDLYMAGKTMIRLLGGDPRIDTLPSNVPPEMAAVILRCVEPSRSRRFQSGKQALDALSQVARSLWGKKYRRLVLPESLKARIN